MTQEQTWLSYVVKLREKHDKELLTLKEKISDMIEQRQKFIMFLRYLEGYPVQYTPGLRAEIENMINYLSK